MRQRSGGARVLALELGVPRPALASSGWLAALGDASFAVAIIPPVALDAKAPEHLERNTRSGRFKAENPKWKAQSGRFEAESPKQKTRATKDPPAEVLGEALRLRASTNNRAMTPKP